MESGNTPNNAFVPDEGHVQTLMAMGFPDETEVKKALRIAKNDISEAVSLLTNEIPGLDDVNWLLDPVATTSNDRTRGRQVEQLANPCTPSTNPSSVETTGANGDNAMDADATDGADDNGESEAAEASLEFPATHLYNLEDRVFTSQWNIPYKREESLGRCLIAATKLAKVGLADSDENCKRFVERCLPECFQKLLTSSQVNQWNGEIQEGIFVMLQLFIDLVTARLQYDPVPLKMMDIMAVIFDQHSRYNQKNSRRSWDRQHWETEFGERSKIPAIPPATYSVISTYDSGDSYGFLVDIINRFVAKGGLETIAKKMESGTLEAQEMYMLLRPLANCADYLNTSAVAALIRSFCDSVVAYVKNLGSEDIKRPSVQNFVVDLLGVVRILGESVLVGRSNIIDELRLDFIQRLLGSFHFGSRMQALKELSKLLEYLNSNNKHEERMAVSSDRLSRWLLDQQILSLALEGNIDQGQYCDRLKTLLAFLGPRLSCQDIGKIWALRNGRTAVTVDNVHNIIAQAAAKFSKNELEHLITLIRTSWRAEGDRNKDKLLILLGVIGRETAVSSTYEMVADVLWDFAHQMSLSETLVTRALEEHLTVVSASGREACRTTFIQRCLSDMREGYFFLPAMAQLHAIVESVKKSTAASSKTQKNIIADLVNSKRLVETLCDCLVRIHTEAVRGCQQAQQGVQVNQRLPVTPVKQVVFQILPPSGGSTGPVTASGHFQVQRIGDQQQQHRTTAPSHQDQLGPDYVLSDGYTLGQYVDSVLAFLRFILNEGELFLLIRRCRELWDTLISDSDSCQYEREAGFSWFSRGIADLEKRCQQTLFEERMLAFDPQLLTASGFECFRKYFESVNNISNGGAGGGNEKRFFPYASASSVQGNGGMAEIDKTDLTGLEYLWQTALNTGDSGIARQAVDMLISVHYTCLASRLKRDPATLHRKFLNECYRRLEGAVLTFKSSPVASLLQDAGRLLAAPSFPALSQAPPPDRSIKVRNIERLLLIAEEYVKTVEAAQTASIGVQPRAMPAHGASFFGSTFVVQVAYEDTTVSSGSAAAKKELTLLSHENEAVGLLRTRLADVLNVEYAKLTLEHEGVELTHNQDQQTMKRLGVAPKTTQKSVLVGPMNGIQSQNPVEEPILAITAKRRHLAAFVSSHELMNKPDNKSTSIFSSTNSRQAHAVGHEINLPAVMMAQDRSAVFDMLHQLVQLDEPTVTTRVRELLLLIPSDPGVIELLDTLTTAAASSSFISSQTPTPASSKTNSLERSAKLGSSPAASLSEKIGNMLIPGTSSSPKLLRVTRDKDKEGKHVAVGATSVPLAGAFLNASSTTSEVLKQLFDLHFPGTTLTPFRVQYNLEILSSRLLPTSYADAQTIQSAQTFAQAFVASQGVQWLLNILRKDYLPINTDSCLRRAIYMTTLKLLCYILCNESALHEILRSHVKHSNVADQSTTAQMKTALATVLATAAAPMDSGNLGMASESGRRLFDRLEPPHSGVAQNLSREQMEFALETLQRLCWAAAGGILHLIGAAELKSPSTSISCASPSAGGFLSLGTPPGRISESSTGSADGLGEVPSTLHAGVLSVHTTANPEDIKITRESFKLIVDCILQRPEEFCQLFFNLPHLADFVMDLLLTSYNVDVRSYAERQLLRLSEVSTSLVTHRSTDSSTFVHPTCHSIAPNAVDESSSFNQMTTTPRFLLLQLLLKARVPLWVPSSHSRGSAHRLHLRCFEYFSLRGRLISSLSTSELSHIQPSPSVMLEDEARWLQNFSCSSDPRLAPADNVLLAAHMLLVTNLLRLPTCQSLKRRTGQCLINLLLNDRLFPAARLIASQTPIANASGDQLRASSSSLVSNFDVKTTGANVECRSVAFELLLELCVACTANYEDITRILTQLHHRYDPELANEWDYSPLVDVKMDGFVGLKNAGATCYMNSVIQQFYNEPGFVEQILLTETDNSDQSAALFIELQRIMGHLRLSEQQYYAPQKFWEVFRLWDQQVNPREQQDAFEFYTCLIDQIDEFLKKSGKDELFRHKYQGVFSDQKICRGCPHSYERAEAFYALNLPVRAHGLEESLNNFVKGEILEGDNAYFCEKCGQKRTALKRMCIKTLPEVTVIQLKRFGYDWEENRALKFNEAFQFPLQLDLYPYTAAALSQMEGQRMQQGGGLEDEDAHWYSLFATSPLSVVGGRGHPGSGSISMFQGSPSSGPSSCPLGRFTRRQSADKRLSTSSATESAKYELVGIVVHSGQANAGHYYAFIKDRRDAGTVVNGSKWYKFNDTTVEMVEMTPQFMEAELFGGKYTAKVEKNSSYPEERERYWNAYLLFYHRIGSDSQTTDPRSSRSASKRSVSMSSQWHAQAPVQSKSARRRDSLMELAELVEQGEQRQLFSSSFRPSCSIGETGSAAMSMTGSQQWWQPPSWLRAEVQEENFRFWRNRDVYNPEYFNFVERLVDLAITAGVAGNDLSTQTDESAAEFGMKFLLNTAWHCRRSLRGDPTVWANRITVLTSRTPAVCRRLIDCFNHPDSTADGGGGKYYLAQFFFDCDNGDVRQAFGSILYHSVIGLKCVPSTDEMDVNERERDQLRCSILLENLLSLALKEAVDKYQLSGAYFYLLRHLAVAGGVELCSLMLQKQAFTILLNFMLPAHGHGSAFLSRRWTLNQARELGDVYGTLAVLMMHCRLRPQEEIDESYYKPRHVHLGDSHRPVIKPPREMDQLITNGQLRNGFVRELVWAACHVNNVLFPLADLTMHCSWRSEPFSQRVVIELLVSIASQPSNDLKHIFLLMEEFLCMDGDGLQRFRAETALDGLTSGTEHVDGLLATIRSAQASGDGRRSYNCIKFLVYAAERCVCLKEALNNRLDRWQWAIDWLRQEMGTATADGGEFTGNVTEASSSATLSWPRHVTASVTVSSSSTVTPSTAPISSTTGTTSSTNYLTVNDGKSNEHSVTKNFQRTVSAQYTLDQAKALFGDVNNQQEEVECDGGEIEPSTSKQEPGTADDGENKSGKKEGNSMFYIE